MLHWQQLHSAQCKKRIYVDAKPKLYTSFLYNVDTIYINFQLNGLGVSDGTAINMCRK